MRLTIAIVEDDAILREELAHFLRSHDFEVIELLTGVALYDVLNQRSVDLIILDLNLPGLSGFDIAKQIKERLPSVGIVMLTARTSLPDRVKGYDSGADIYLPKPTLPAEILAAINSLSRRLGQTQVEQPWRLLTTRYLLQGPLDGHRVGLTHVEQQLLLCLAQAPNMAVDADTICNELATVVRDTYFTRRALENIISRLRKKVADSDMTDSLPFIRSVRGMGYQLCVPISIVFG